MGKGAEISVTICVCTHNTFFLLISNAHIFELCGGTRQRKAAYKEIMEQVAILNGTREEAQLEHQAWWPRRRGWMARAGWASPSHRRGSAREPQIKALSSTELKSRSTVFACKKEALPCVLDEERRDGVSKRSCCAQELAAHKGRVEKLSW